MHNNLIITSLVASLLFIGCELGPTPQSTAVSEEQTRTETTQELVAGVGVTPTIFNPGFEIREAARPVGWTPAPCSWTWSQPGTWGVDIDSARFIGQYGSVAIFTDVINCEVWSTTSTMEPGFGVFQLRVTWKIENSSGSSNPVSVGVNWMNDNGVVISQEGSGFPGITCTNPNDPSTCNDIPVVNGQWQTAVLTIYKPISATRFKLRLTHLAQWGGTVYFDETSITRIK